MRSNGGPHWKPWGTHLASDHVIDISKSLTSRSGASARPSRATRLLNYRASLPTSTTARSKAADPNDGSTGDEFDCAPAPRFDGAARSAPTPARCAFGASPLGHRHERTLSPGDSKPPMNPPGSSFDKPQPVLPLEQTHRGEGPCVHQNLRTRSQEQPRKKIGRSCPSETAHGAGRGAPSQCTRGSLRGKVSTRSSRSPPSPADGSGGTVPEAGKGGRRRPRSTRGLC